MCAKKMRVHLIKPYAAVTLFQPSFTTDDDDQSITTTDLQTYTITFEPFDVTLLQQPNLLLASQLFPHAHFRCALFLWLSPAGELFLVLLSTLPDRQRQRQLPPPRSQIVAQYGNGARLDTFQSAFAIASAHPPEALLRMLQSRRFATADHLQFFQMPTWFAQATRRHPGVKLHIILQLECSKVAKSGGGALVNTGPIERPSFAFIQQQQSGEKRRRRFQVDRALLAKGGCRVAEGETLDLGAFSSGGGEPGLIRALLDALHYDCLELVPGGGFDRVMEFYRTVRALGMRQLERVALRRLAFLISSGERLASAYAVFCSDGQEEMRQYAEVGAWGGERARAVII